MNRHLTKQHLFSCFALLALSASGCSDLDGSVASPGSEVTVQARALNASDYPSIQAAIDAAGPGETVTVAAGAYTEDLTLKTDVTLAGAGHNETTIYGRVEVTEASNASLRDLTLNGGLSAGGATGLTITDSSATVERVVVVDFGTGVSVKNTGAFAVNGSTLLNAMQVTGAKDEGIRIENATSLTVQNSVVAYCSGDGIRAVFGLIPAQNLIFTNNLLLANGYGLFNGAGFRMEETVGFVITNSIAVSNNVGVYCKASCPVDYSVVWGNLLDYSGFATAHATNIQADPRFVDAAGGDYTLLFDSPAIDAGGATWAPDSDALGRSRPLGAGIDIGPYEFLAAPAEITIAINEIMSNPLNEGHGEYIELYNFGADAIDLAGFVISDGDATDTLTGYQGGSTVVPGGSYAVIVDPGYPGGIYNIPADAVLLTAATTASLGSGLSNADPVKLFTADGITPVDSYSFPFNAGNGISVEKDSIADGDVGSNWVASPCGHTPGASNCASLPPNVSKDVLLAINEVMANPLDETTGEFIEIYNFGNEGVNMGGMLLSDGDALDTVTGWKGGPTVLAPGQFAVILDPDYAGTYTIPPGTLLLGIEGSSSIGNGLANSDPISLLLPGGLTVIDTYTHTFNAGNGVSVEKVDATIGDIASNFSGSTCDSGSSPGAVNCVTQDGAVPIGGATLAITEVMANALDEDRDEYIEIFNYGAEAIDLVGYRISDGDKEEKLQALVDGGVTVLESGAYALIVDAEYAGKYSVPPGTVMLTTSDTSIGSGLSTNDPIRLRAPKGAAAVDTYLFPFNPGNGVSAEKIDLVIGDVPQNWVPSPCNASPGKKNCADGDLGGDAAPVSTTAITVSEVMANPLQESTGEYVELFNAGPVGVDISGWKLSDGDATDEVVGWKGGPTTIAPGQFAVILDPDYSGQYTIPNEALRLTVTNKTLGNGMTTGDPVTLYETDGVTIVAAFSFPYNPGNGTSVEKVSLTGGDVAANWVTSTCKIQVGDDNNGGSPGARNCADPYSFNGNNALGQACPFGAADCLSNLCAIDLLTNVSFCTESCAADPSGCPQGFECTTIQDINYSQICVPVGGGGAPDLRISELLYDAVGTDKDVFIELKGAPDTIVDGLSLVGINGSNGKIYSVIPLYGYVGPSGYFVIAHPGASLTILAMANMTTSKVNYQNGPDTVQLRFGETVLDAIGYGDFTTAVFAGEGTPSFGVSAPGQSLVRPDGWSDTDNNSVDFAISVNPTPGLDNAICGNNVVETPETCDDGNAVGGDECPANCIQ